MAISLDTRAFRDPSSGNKIGLGSSAALAAALSVALESIGGARARDAAHAGHRTFQGGAGSGVDVACGIAGGISIGVWYLGTSLGSRVPLGICVNVSGSLKC